MPHDPHSGREAPEDQHDTLEAKQRRFAAKAADLGRPPETAPLTRGFPISKPLGRIPDSDLRKADPE